MEYIKILDELFANSDEESKLAFLGSEIFDFTTYQSSMDELFARKMLEVIQSILNQTTFKYIEKEENYINYLMMVNMPFLKDKIEWGTSIRGAWFDEYGHSMDTEKTYKLGYEYTFPKKKIKTVISAIIEWSKI